MENILNLAKSIKYILCYKKKNRYQIIKPISNFFFFKLISTFKCFNSVGRFLVEINAAH